jgi:hypothetical protein
MDSKYYETYFSSTEDISFQVLQILPQLITKQEAIQPFTDRVFGISKPSLLHYHTTFMTMLKSQLSGTKTEMQAETLVQSFANLTEEYNL